MQLISAINGLLSYLEFLFLIVYLLYCGCRSSYQLSSFLCQYNSVFFFIYRTHFSTQLAQGRSVRFIYHGRELADLAATLEDHRIQDHSAIHVHIGQTRQQGNRNGDTMQQADQIFDLSWLFVPLFGLMLAVVWACFLLWSSVFSLLTKLFLFVLSLGYVLLAYYSRSWPHLPCKGRVNRTVFWYEPVHCADFFYCNILKKKHNTLDENKHKYTSRPEDPK